MATKVVLEQTVLGGTGGSGVIQRVATVYIDGVEYRVSAPPEAKGAAADWIEHLYVRQWGDMGAEEEAPAPFRVLAICAVDAELRKKAIAEGLHPDGVHCTAQICKSGHVQHCDGMQFDSKAHCTKCGAACIGECPHCHEPIRGGEKCKAVDTYQRPQYCHGCGRPYPWMEDRLRTARELLRLDEKLTEDDRKELFDLLKDVMSDPMSPLVPAKKKILEGKLERVEKWVREIVLDLAAKTAAEMTNG
jgi:hypothetical protein